MSTRICITPNALDHPYELDEQNYLQLVQRKKQGWSHCDSSEEFMAKLHYLRGGFMEGKIKQSDFLERESRLIIDWWRHT